MANKIGLTLSVSLNYPVKYNNLIAGIRGRSDGKSNDGINEFKPCMSVWCFTIGNLIWQLYGNVVEYWHALKGRYFLIQM